DEPCKLPGDRGDDDGLELAPARERAIAGVEAALRLPGDLAHRPRRGRNLLLLLPSHPRRMPVAPRAFHQDAARPAVAGLGDRTAFDRLPGRMLRRHQAE